MEVKGQICLFPWEFHETSWTHVSSLDCVSHTTYRFLPSRLRSEVEVKCRYCVKTLSHIGKDRFIFPW